MHGTRTFNGNSAFDEPLRFFARHQLFAAGRLPASLLGVKGDSDEGTGFECGCDSDLELGHARPFGEDEVACLCCEIDSQWWFEEVKVAGALTRKAECCRIFPNR